MDLPDSPVKTGFKGGVQFTVFPAGRKLVRQVIGALLVAAKVLFVGRFQCEVPVAVDAEDHPLVQAKAAADQDGEARCEGGADA